MIAAAFALSLALQVPPDDGPMATAAPAGGETAAELRLREALAYSNPLPRGAPEGDYAFVAWCDALITGHVALGESLTTADDLDREIIRLGRLERQDFREALAAAGPRQTPAARAEAERIRAQRLASWDAFTGQDEATRSQAFGLFFGLPGRCEHAARRIRAGIATPPATPEDVGLRREGEDTPVG